MGGGDRGFVLLGKGDRCLVVEREEGDRVL